MPSRPWRCLIGALAIAAMPMAPLWGQYYNTHSGHPGRVEDATPAARRSVDFDLLGARVERLSGGITRTRTEPGFAWGALPQTEVGLRLPIVWLSLPGPSGPVRTAGVAGVGLSALRALTVQTPGVPALALATEWLLPAGGLAAPRASYVFKLLATQRWAGMRVHANVGGGTYSVRGARPQCDSTAVCDGPPIIIDLPCSVGPGTPLNTRSRDARSRDARTLDMRSRDARHLDAAAANVVCLAGATTSAGTSAASVSSPPAPSPPREYGARWVAGVGVDRALPLASLLFSANVFAERFVGLYTRTDATAEAGARWQVAPRTVLDAGVSWRFAGTIRSVSINVGSSIEVAMPLLVRRP